MATVGLLAVLGGPAVLSTSATDPPQAEDPETQREDKPDDPESGAGQGSFAVSGEAGATPPAGSTQEAPAGSESGTAADPGATGEDLGSGLVERAEVELGLIEAVVVDKAGRHIRGLPRSAFRLVAGSKELPIVTFDEIQLSGDTLVRREVPSPPETEDVPGDPAAPQDPRPQSTIRVDPEQLQRIREEREARLGGPRWFVMIFDGYNNVSPLRFNAIRKQAKAWLYENMKPMDNVAIYAFTPYLSSICGFTDDLFTLTEAIDNTPVFPASNMGDQFTSQRLEQGDWMPRNMLEEQLMNAADFGQDLLSQERDQYYVNFSQLVDTMWDLRGTRAVLLFSGGFPVTMSRSTTSTGGFSVRCQRMLHNLESQGIRVFSFDIGEEGTFTDIEHSTNYRMELDRLGLGSEWLDELQVGAQRDATNAHQEILAILGNETGGRFWPGRDYKTGLQIVADDLTHYYLVGFDPSTVPLTARGYSRLKLEIDQKGTRVLARRSQFDDKKPNRPERFVPQEPIEEPTGEPLIVSARPQFFPASRDKTLVVVPIRIEGPIDLFDGGKDAMVLDLTVDLEATAGGQSLVAGDRSVRLQIDAERAAAFANGVRIREAMLVPTAGDVEIEVSVRQNGLGRVGTWKQRMEVPERTTAAFGVTDLVVLNVAESAPLVFDAFFGGKMVFGTDPPAPLPDPLGVDRTGRPAAYVGGGYPRTVPLLAQTQVVAPPPAPSDGGSPLRMDWELIPSDGGEPLAPPVRYHRLQMAAAGSMLDVVVDLDLKDVAPGDYLLRLTAVDLVGDGRDVREMPVIVTE